MSNSIAPGSSVDVNVKVTALTTNPNVPAQYKTIILKKNLVNGVNTLTQEMMSAANTKYVIKYDYVLGEDITVPANCILEFDGGSISASDDNDTIAGTNTSIQAGLIKIFNIDATLDGTWNVAEFYPEWFGAKGDGETDDTIAIQKCFRKNIKWWQTPNMGKKNVPSYTVKFSPKTYIITDDIIIWSGIDCNLGNAIIKQTNSAKNAFVFRHDNGYQSYGCWNSRIENGIIVGVGKATSTGYGIRCERLNGGVISNVEVYGFKIGIALLETQYTLIERIFTHSNRVGLYLSSMADTKNLPTIDNTLIEVSSGYNDYGVWLQKCSFNNFYTLDSGRNSHADVLFGPQLTGYIKNINVTNGGSGYPASSNLPLTITDTDGIDAECYAVTNEQGVITSCVIFTSGIKYTNPSIAVNADSGSGASFTVELGNDSGIGEWDGTNSPINGGNRIYNLKIEHILADKPITGYDIIMTDDNWDNNYIYNVVGDLQGGSNYSKLALINGPLTINDICFPDRTNGFVNPYTGDNYVIDVTNTRVYLIFNYYIGSINQVKWLNNNIKNLCGVEYIRPQTGHTIMRGHIVNTRQIIDESGNIKGNLLCYVDANEVESNRGKGVILYDNVTKNIGFAKNDSIVYDAFGYLNKPHRGTSTNRPTGMYNNDRDKGFIYFDTTLGKPIWWNGTAWVDATGATV